MQSSAVLGAPPTAIKSQPAGRIGIMEDSANWYAAETATFGDRVTGAREALGIGQPELARRLGVKVKTLRDWENDISEPRANKLQMLAGILGVSLMWLLNGEGEGIDAPTGEQGGNLHRARDLLLEIRSVSQEVDRAAGRLARIEKQLRQLLAAEEAQTDRAE
jgi:transcriptional regulator with XRE-family HTH domain